MNVTTPEFVPAAPAIPVAPTVYTHFSQPQSAPDPQYDGVPIVPCADPIWVLFHKGCPDGIAAALAFRLHAFEWAARFRGCVGTNDVLVAPASMQWLDPARVQFHAVRDHNFIADRHMPSLAGAHVIIVDFSYPMDVLRSIERIALSITVIDHHDSAVVADAPEWYHVDTTACAAIQVWKRIHGIAPQWLRHIDDRDRWVDEMHPDSAAFSEAFIAENMQSSFRACASLLYMSEADCDRFLTSGRAMLKKTRTLCERISWTSWLGAMHTGAAAHTYKVRVVNTSVLRSAVANVILSKHQDDYDFVVVIAYCDGDDGPKWSVSMRSDGRVNVAHVATEFGGGGHTRAAGFTYHGHINDIITAVHSHSRPRAHAAQTRVHTRIHIDTSSLTPATVDAPAVSAAASTAASPNTSSTSLSSTQSSSSQLRLASPQSSAASSATSSAGSRTNSNESIH